MKIKNSTRNRQSYSLQLQPGAVGLARHFEPGFAAFP
jgi:hypothetical protein